MSQGVSSGYAGAPSLHREEGCQRSVRYRAAVFLVFSPRTGTNYDSHDKMCVRVCMCFFGVDLSVILIVRDNGGVAALYSCLLSTLFGGGQEGRGGDVLRSVQAR